MKQVKKKKVKVNKARVSIILICLLLICALIIKGSKSKKQTKAMECVSTFMSYINDRKYEEMYDMLSETTKKRKH